MSEKLQTRSAEAEIDNEQYAWGALLGIIVDYELDFQAGDFGSADLADAIGDVMTALYDAREGADQILDEYGITGSDDCGLNTEKAYSEEEL